VPGLQADAAVRSLLRLPMLQPSHEMMLKRGSIAIIFFHSSWFCCVLFAFCFLFYTFVWRGGLFPD